MFQFQFLAFLMLLGKAYEHEWREKNGDEAKGNNSKDGGAKKDYHHPFNDFLNDLQLSVSL
jgi:hypothetical protein